MSHFQQGGFLTFLSRESTAVYLRDFIYTEEWTIEYSDFIKLIYQQKAEL